VQIVRELKAMMTANGAAPLDHPAAPAEFVSAASTPGGPLPDAASITAR
jgi:hypothetical protein